MIKATPVNNNLPSSMDDYLNSLDLKDALENRSHLFTPEDLAELQKFYDQCEDYISDWNWGATLIRYTEFKNYTMELAHETCNISFHTWPLNCIDWDFAAVELKYDYTALEWNGVVYYGLSN